jgi:hypothetical protein
MGVMNKLFHRQAFGLPKFTLPVLTGLVLSSHAKEQIVNRNISFSPQSFSFDSKCWNIFELELDENQLVTKIVGRRRYNNWFDMAIAIGVSNKLIRTIWLTRVGDTHSTLDKGKYSKPDSF